MSLESIHRMVQCPVSLEIMNEAVTLHPCLEVVQKRIAKHIMEAKGQPSPSCPLCHKQVTNYKPNEKITNLAKAYLLIKQELSQLPETSKKVNIGEPTPYPGVPSHFVYEGGDWDDCEHYNIQTRRAISFTSVNSDALITSFVLRALRSGTVRCEIAINKRYRDEKNGQNIYKYFALQGIKIDEWSFATSDEIQLRKLFKIMAENNEFPEDYFSQLKEIVATGNVAPYHSDDE
jgi:hypothetical protein